MTTTSSESKIGCQLRLRRPAADPPFMVGDVFEYEGQRYQVTYADQMVIAFIPYRNDRPMTWFTPKPCALARER
jgi:hypothetical protein